MSGNQIRRMKLWYRVVPPPPTINHQGGRHQIEFGSGIKYKKNGNTKNNL